MIHFVLIIGLFLLVRRRHDAGAGSDGARGTSTDALDQIGAYGFAGTLPSQVEKEHGPGFRARLDDVAPGDRPLARPALQRLRGKDYRSRLIAAGMYTTTPERLLGTQFLVALGGTFLWIWLAILAGARAAAPRRSELIGVAAAGWVLPMFIVNSRAKKRRDQVERGLPDLIDLLVVTLEAGLSFPQSLRLAATKVREPLASEVRLTLQEQNMGLTLVEALENLLARVDTPGVRMFSRSIAQGETMGVSTGQIMRNLAVEMRKRQRAYAEERAQKAPVKILFPILFLIMPALFIVILLPVMMNILEVLGG